MTATGLTATGMTATLRSGSLADEVVDGLRKNPKALPPKLFYDHRGAELFELICELPEYYLTRSELSILRERAAEIAALAGDCCALIEYGSGAGVKARLILDALENPVAYVPVDISSIQLNEVAAGLSADFPGIAVVPVAADYTSRFHLPPLPAEVRRKVAFFPGSTIGNFQPAEAEAFLSSVRDLVGDDGAMILGVDRVKDKADLDAAYNDSAGLTAAFNLNMLERINRDLNAEFDLASFEHVAYFNEEASRVEMHLRSLIAQVVCVAGRPIEFAAGETIWTESSYKYSESGLQRLVAAGGFSVERLWTDEDEKFWVAYLSP